MRALSSSGLQHIRRRDRQTTWLRRLDHRKAEAVNARIEEASSEKRLDKPDADVNRQIRNDKSACQR